MASSSSNPSSTSPSTASRSECQNTDHLDAQSLYERTYPPLPTRDAAPTTSAALGVAPGAIIASATAPGVSRSNTPPPKYHTLWGGTKRVPPPANLALALAHQRRGRSRRTRNSADVSQPRKNPVGLSQHVSNASLLESGWESAPAPTSALAPTRSSTANPSPPTSAWTRPFLSSSTVASTRTDNGIAVAASSSAATPSPDSTLVPDAPGSAPAVATSADTAPEPDASISATSFAPAVATSADTAPEPDASISATSFAPGVTTSADRALEPDALTSSASSSAPGADPTVSSLIDNLQSLLAAEWGIPQASPRPVETCPGQQAIGGNKGVHPVDDLYPDPLRAWRDDVAPRAFGYYDISPADIPLCSECRLRSAQIEARPYDHLDICARCYAKRFVCPKCGYDALGAPPPTRTHRG